MKKHIILIFIILLPFSGFSQNEKDIQYIFNEIIYSIKDTKFRIIKYNMIDLTLKDFYGDTIQDCESGNEVRNQHISPECNLIGKTIDYNITISGIKYKSNPYYELKELSKIEICEINHQINKLDLCNIPIKIDWKKYNTGKTKVKFTETTTKKNTLLISRPVFTADNVFAIVKIYRFNNKSNESKAQILIFQRKNEEKWEVYKIIYGG